MSDDNQSTNGTTKRKPGRPKKHIDLELVERLAHIQCTQPEIASALNVSVDTLWRHPQFAEVYKRGAEGGKKSIRRMQFESANRGSVGMQIWLGKQYLGQSDHITETHISPEDLDPKQLVSLAFSLRGEQLTEFLKGTKEMMEARIRELRGENQTPHTIDILPTPGDGPGSPGT